MTNLCTRDLQDDAHPILRPGSSLGLRFAGRLFLLRLIRLELYGVISGAAV